MDQSDQGGFMGKKVLIEAKKKEQDLNCISQISHTWIRRRIRKEDKA